MSTSKPSSTFKRLLAVETSCDETSAAIVDGDGNLLAHRVRSQEDYHRQFSGIVPEVASRAHSAFVIPVMQQMLEDTKLAWSDIDGFAVTAGPGLLGSLLVGVMTVKSFAVSLNRPVFGLDHIEAHIAAAYIDDQADDQAKIFTSDLKPEFPLLALVVSGGHTMLFLMHGFGQMQVLGFTLDDAVGEAYDKVAKFLELGYPGGPIIDRMAAQTSAGDIRFPVPMLKSGDLNFSFSGLKTAVRNHWQQLSPEQRSEPDIKDRTVCAFQDSAIEALTVKLRLALKKYPQVQQVVACGGVSCNRALRQRLQDEALLQGRRLLLPKPKYCTDNAAMVAALAYGYATYAPESLQQRRGFSSYTSISQSRSLWKAA